MISVIIVVHFFVAPWQKKKILEQQRASNDIEGFEGDGLSSSSQSIEQNEKIVDKLFHFLQILSAVFTSFAHGGEFEGKNVKKVI